MLPKSNKEASNSKPQHPLSFKALNILGKYFFGDIFASKYLLNVDSLMSKARGKTGLNDFGPDTFYKSFEMLINSLNRDAKLTTVGQITIHIILLNSLIVRLKTQQWVKEHPEVLEEEIEKPFLITGLPRTGTTILSFLMEMDPENRSLLHWQADNPVPPPQLATMAEDPRIYKCVKNLKLLEKVIPGYQAIHPMSATIPTECIQLMSHEFKNPFFAMLANISGYLDWIKDVDLVQSYLYHKLLLQILQSRVPVQTWALKSPVHCFRLKTLLQVYPDVRLIFTHRNPQKVIPSICSLITTFRSGLSDHVNPIDIGKDAIKLYQAASQKLMTLEKDFPNNNFYHLGYSRFMKDPIDALRGIYAHFGKEVKPLHEKNMQAWVKFNPKDKHGYHKYTLKDFGLTPELIEEEFGDYRKFYDIPFD